MRVEFGSPSDRAGGIYFLQSMNMKIVQDVVLNKNNDECIFSFIDS